MITIDYVHFLVKESLNKLNTNYYEDIPSNIIDENLYMATLQFVRDRLNYKKGNGFEVDSIITKDLSTLVKTEYLVQPISLGNGLYKLNLANKYAINGCSLEHDCYLFQTAMATVTKNNCTKKVPCFMIEHDDKNFVKNGVYRKSSFKWNRLIAYIESGANYFPFSSLILDTNSDFEINSVDITYIKYPNKVCLGGYENIEEETLFPVQFDFQDEQTLAIKDIAVTLISEKLGLPNFQTKTLIEEKTKQ